jgi:hypothetical protein
MSVRPRAIAIDSETPSGGLSALVWHVCRAMPFEMRSCTTRPLGDVAATDVTPDR